MSVAKQPITEEFFKAATGYEPVDDDLERCNCPKAGQPMHHSCGWNYIENGPCFQHGQEGEKS